MNIKYGKNNWKIYWGVMPLPEGAESLGIVEHDGQKGALIKLANGNHVMGNAGGIRSLPRIITPHKGGRQTTFPHARATAEERQRFEKMRDSLGLSSSDFIVWLLDQVNQPITPKTN
jgi:hypothetical protein